LSECPLHVPHGRFLPRCGAVMPALARTTRARASAAECVAARPDDESTGKMPGDSRTAIRLRLRARSPAFRSARPLSHGECACCACRSGRSARMRARVLPGPGPRLALAPTAPLDTRHHERHEHDDDQDPGLRPSGDPGDSWPASAANSRCLLLTAHRQ
jgi:hypothetical protein